MNTPIRRVLYWSPRVLCILFAAFISMFALDAFGGGKSFLVCLGAFCIHLIPTAILVVVLVLSWRWEWVGAVVFTALGALYLTLARGRFPWEAYALISGPLFLLGFLFLFNWVHRVELRAR